MLDDEEELDVEVTFPLELLEDELELDELLALGSPPQAVNPATKKSPAKGFITLTVAAASPARARAVRLFIRPSTRI